MGLTKRSRPRGSFLFLGPTGVGKTQVTIAFTEFLMSPDHLFRFDMSEYQTPESIGVLLGGKLGERGTLALARDRHDHGTLLCDEIEKAHPRVVEFLRARGHDIEPSEAVLSFLVRRGFHPRLGARPMRDVVEKSIGDAVANELLTGGTGCGKLTVDESGERLRITL